MVNFGGCQAVTDMEEKRICPHCGHEIEEGSIVCMYCGHSANPATDSNLSKIDKGQMQESNNASAVTTGRVIAIGVLLMNAITIMICAGDSILSSVCMLSALICGAISLGLVAMSFTIDKKKSPQEIDNTVASITKGAVAVLIFSGADFFVALNSIMF